MEEKYLFLGYDLLCSCKNALLENLICSYGICVVFLHNLENTFLIYIIMMKIVFVIAKFLRKLSWKFCDVFLYVFTSPRKKEHI